MALPFLAQDYPLDEMEERVGSVCHLSGVDLAGDSVWSHHAEWCLPGPVLARSAVRERVWPRLSVAEVHSAVQGRRSDPARSARRAYSGLSHPSPSCAAWGGCAR